MSDADCYEEIDLNDTYIKEPSRYWVYKLGQQKYDNNGDLLFRKEKKESIQPGAYVDKTTKVEIPAEFDGTKYVLKVSDDMFDESGTTNFLIEYESNEYLYENQAYESSTYAKEHGKIAVFPCVDFDFSYSLDVKLLYENEQRVISDANSTNNHLQVLERPIRQKVKIVKDIQVMPESETYMHDTYSDVHQENIDGTHIFQTG